MQSVRPEAFSLSGMLFRVDAMHSRTLPRQRNNIPLGFNCLPPSAAFILITIIKEKKL